MRHSNIANEKKSTQGHVPHSSTILDHDIQPMQVGMHKMIE